MPMERGAFGERVLIRIKPTLKQKVSQFVFLSTLHDWRVWLSVTSLVIMLIGLGVFILGKRHADKEDSLEQHDAASMMSCL